MHTKLNTLLDTNIAVEDGRDVQQNVGIHLKGITKHPNVDDFVVDIYTILCTVVIKWIIKRFRRIFHYYKQFSFYERENDCRAYTLCHNREKRMSDFFSSL